MRSFKVYPNHLLYTSGSCKFEGESIIYSGIKLELGDKPEIKISISSMKRSQRDSYLSELLEQLFVQDFSSLAVGKKAWVLRVEVFMLNAIDEAYLEAIAHSISHSLQDLKIPAVKVTKNYLTDEEDYEIMEEQMQGVQFKIPKVQVIGQVGVELVKDLTFEEFHQVERKYIVVSGSQVRSFDKMVESYLPEDFLRVITFAKS